MHLKDALSRKLLAFITACMAYGILAAWLVVPAAAESATVAGRSISFPSHSDLSPPARNSKVLASDGSVIATFYSQNRVPVSLDRTSPLMRDAIISIEDARFLRARRN